MRTGRSDRGMADRGVAVRVAVLVLVALVGVLAPVGPSGPLVAGADPVLVVTPDLDAAAPLVLRGADLSNKDNATLAAALGQVMEALGGLRDRKLIDDAELLRLAYRFAGEVVDVEAMLRRARQEA